MRISTKRLLRKIRYYLLIAAIFIFAAAALVTGAAIVSVNCHNVMSADRISLFEIEKRGDETIISVMGREIKAADEDRAASE